MSSTKDKTFAMPDHYDVTVAAFRRFERRSGVKLFEALADVCREAGEGVDGMTLAKAVFTDSESLAAFIYECGLSQKQRGETTFDDWIEGITIGELFTHYDKAITALFTFSPTHPETTPDLEAGKGKIEAPKTTKIPVTPGPGSTSLSSQESLE